MGRSFLAVAIACAFLVATPAGAQQNTDKPPSPAQLKKLLADTDSIAKTISKLRGLPIRRKIKRGAMSRAQIKSRVLLRFDEEYKKGEIEGEELSLKRMGLLPKAADYKKLVLDLLADQIAGFYDPSTRELYIADWIDVTMQRPVMAHEIDHALQDQSFNLKAFLKPNKKNSDAQLARHALVEGDGLAVMIEFALAEMGMQMQWSQPAIMKMMSQQIQKDIEAELGHAPLFLRESLIFPYLAGLTLIAHTRRLHSWSRVDRMYKKPPRSTEQVMHPEKYFNDEKPIKVSSAKLSWPRDWTTVHENVLGEIGFQILFRHHKISPARAETAAEGWGGDRFVVLAPKGATKPDPASVMLISLSAWDTEGEAVEAFEVGAEVLQAIDPAAKCRMGKKVGRCKDKEGRRHWIERKGNRMLLVLGNPAGRSVRAEVWSRWQVQPSK